MTFGEAMLTALKRLLTARRAKAKIKGVFGRYVSPGQVQRIADGGSTLQAGLWEQRKVRVIVFFCPEWGFSDASLPRLRSILRGIDTPVDVSHDGLTAWFEGEAKKDEFERVRLLLESVAAEPDFRGFRIGVAEGDSESMIDNWRIAGEAFRNGRAA